ncbi:MAG: DUF2281 domain-containing protein [Candidatus Sumerlaeia bacterium]
MTTEEKIADHLRKMPEAEKAEVLDFIEYLETKARQRRFREEAETWSTFSLTHALNGMEDEPSEYSREDLKEVF